VRLQRGKWKNNGYWVDFGLLAGECFHFCLRFFLIFNRWSHFLDSFSTSALDFKPGHLVVSAGLTQLPTVEEQNTPSQPLGLPGRCIPQVGWCGVSLCLPWHCRKYCKLGRYRGHQQTGRRVLCYGSYQCTTGVGRLPWTSFVIDTLALFCWSFSRVKGV
jgi:hypothetical protein